jgi:hypothetical protein
LSWTGAPEALGGEPRNGGYARAHGFLVEAGGPPQSLMVTRDKLYLTKVTAATLRKRLETNIFRPQARYV